MVRKSLPDLFAMVTGGKVRYQAGELAALPRGGWRSKAVTRSCSSSTASG